MRRASVTVPRAFEASVKATIRVRVADQRPRARRGRACRPRRAAATVRTASSWSCATRSHGETFASWSSCVDDDLVARLERARDRVREQEVERRHVRAERDLLRLRRRRSRRRPRAPRRSRRRTRAEVAKAPPRFAFDALQVAGHRVDHRPRHLRAAGPVEVQRRLAGDRARRGPGNGRERRRRRAVRARRVMPRMRSEPAVPRLATIGPCSADARSQPRPRTRPCHRGRRAGRRALGRARRQDRRRPGRRRRDAPHARHRRDGRPRGDRRGREGRGADALQRRARSATARRRRSTSRSIRSRARRCARKGKPNALAVIALAERGAMFDPGPVLLHGEDGRRRRHRRPALARGPDRDVCAQIAERSGVPIGDLMVVMLDRPRHDETMRASARPARASA